MSDGRVCQLRCPACGAAHMVERAKLPALPFTARCRTCSVQTTFTQLPGSQPDGAAEPAGRRATDLARGHVAPQESAAPTRPPREAVRELLTPLAPAPLVRASPANLARPGPAAHVARALPKEARTIVTAHQTSSSQLDGVSLGVVAGLSLCGISALLAGVRAVNMALPKLGARDLVLPSFAAHALPLVLTTLLLVRWLLSTGCAADISGAVLGVVRGVVSPLTAASYVTSDDHGRRQLQSVFVPFAAAVWLSLGAGALLARTRTAFAALLLAFAAAAAGVVLLGMAKSFLRNGRLTGSANGAAAVVSPLSIAFEAVLATCFGVILGSFT